jgi:hypothetical protein
MEQEKRINFVFIDDFGKVIEKGNVVRKELNDVFLNGVLFNKDVKNYGVGNRINSMINARRNNQKIVFIHDYGIGLFLRAEIGGKPVAALSFFDNTRFQENVGMAERRKIIAVFPDGYPFIGIKEEGVF